MRHFSLWLSVLCLWISFGATARAEESVAIGVDPVCGLPQIRLSGESFDTYSLEAASSLDPNAPWEQLLQLSFPLGEHSWCDPEARSRARRFYRMVRYDAPPPEMWLRNFRLNDLSGRSRELYYSFSDASVTAYALVFTGTTLSNVAPHLPTLSALASDYASQGIRVWIISCLQGNDRSRLIQEAVRLGVQLPVLHDRSEIVTREFSVSRVPEVALVRNRSFSVLYRGAIEEPGSTDPGHQYLKDAIDNMLNESAPTLFQVRPRGQDVATQPIPTPLYSTEIAPLLKAKCVSCHSPGNIAPWSMTNHAEILANVDSIKDEILSARMPPWHADPYVGQFANDSSLTADEATKIVEWLNAGAPRGEGADPLEEIIPEPPAWPLGTPDLILTIPKQSLPAKGDIDYRYITIDPLLASNTWLRAAVVRPGNRLVVHHSLVFLGDALSSLGGLSGYFAGYVPGLDPSFFPDGTAKLLPKGTKLTFQMHYVSVGTAQTDQTQLGLYFYKGTPALKFQTKAVADIFFSIPAQKSEHIVKDVKSSPFAKAALLYELSPHMHLRGKWFYYELELPNGTRRPIMNVPHYLFAWQRLYRFKDPIQIPAGSRLVCTGAFDNSPENVFNPDPTDTVRFGEQTYEEMFIGYYNYGEAP